MNSIISIILEFWWGFTDVASIDNVALTTNKATSYLTDDVASTNDLVLTNDVASIDDVQHIIGLIY